MNGVAKSCARAKRFEQSVTAVTLQRDKQKKKKHIASLLSPPRPQHCHHDHRPPDRPRVIKISCNTHRFSLNFLILKLEVLFLPNRPYPLASPGIVLIPFRLNLPQTVWKIQEPAKTKKVRDSLLSEMWCVRAGRVTVPSPSGSLWFYLIQLSRDPELFCAL